MPFKLGEVTKSTPKAKTAPQTPPAQENGAIRVAALPSSVSATPQPKRQQAPKESWDSLPLPFQISHFVLFRKSNGSVQMKQCATEAAAKEYKEKLEAGYVGN